MFTQTWDFTDRCKNKEYNISALPQASAIVTFHESEDLDELLHTLHSIVYNTDIRLLKEVILINDCSNKGYILCFRKYILISLK